MGVGVRLSAKAVEKQKHAGYFGDGGGLYLQVTPSGAKSWIFRYTLNGRAREMGLGSVRVVTLAEARHKAQQERKLLVEKIDPIENRNAHRTAQALDKARQITFGECAQKYIEAHRAGWRNEKHAYQWGLSFSETYCGRINALPVTDVNGVVTASLKNTGELGVASGGTVDYIPVERGANLEWRSNCSFGSRLCPRF